VLRIGGLGALGVGLGLLLPWQIAVAMGVKPVILPPIDRVLRSALELLQDRVLVPSVLASLFRVNAGFLLAALTAVPLGIALGRSRRWFTLCEPLIESFRFVIPFAWIPLAVLWFGTSELGKLFIIWYAGFFLILLHTIAGVRGVDPDLVKAARTLGAGEGVIFRKVVLPAAMPATMTGLRIGFAASWIALIAAEMVAARSGLGYLIMDARELLQTDIVVVGMAVIAVIGATYNGLFALVQRRLFRHRAPAARL
jgi:ABC-type nitrate/sulfonate/bicarbonate transport system permease component